MLTDIFSYRYLKHPIWQDYTENEQRLLNQLIGVAFDAIPYYKKDGSVDDINKEKWKTLHNKLVRELGVDELSPRYYSYTQKNANGVDMPISGFWGWDIVCKKFVTAPFIPHLHRADQFIKERISLIELALRLRGEEVSENNTKLPNALRDAEISEKKAHPLFKQTFNLVDRIKVLNNEMNTSYAMQVDEINERFRRAGAPLTYHNGFIQVSLDEVVEKSIAKPFWQLVSSPEWKNVDIDMKEALDRRDANDKDPAIFAAKALESAIKIVSDMKGWTRGSEKGASQYIDNLVSKANGSLLTTWEGELLADYFKKVRNSLGHGPGSEPMPNLSIAQTDWAIETAMSWIRTIIRRI